MEVTLSGMAMPVKAVQPENAPDSIAVTLAGMVTSVSLAQLANALEPMVVTPTGTLYVVFPSGQSSRVLCSLSNRAPSQEENCELPASTEISVRLAHPSKVFVFIRITLEGMDTLVRLVQPVNAPPYPHPSSPI